MTYCVAMSLEAGMLFASDSRTNAGVDQIARFSKMRVIAHEGDRLMVTLSSGNLSITQNALNMLEERSRAGDNSLSLYNATSMFDVARLIGDSLREAKSRDGPYLMQSNIDSSASFLVGGQIHGEPPPDGAGGAELLAQILGELFEVDDAPDAGEADAGLVYVTDVQAAGDKVKGIEFPESSSVVNTYPIGALADSKNKELAQEFVDLVTGDAGQQVLADAGFAKP